MGFLKRLFGGSDTDDVDRSASEGLFLYVKCDKCGDRVRLFVHKSHELNRSNGGYVWHKTIVDSKCFQPIKTVVTFDNQFKVVNSEIDGGHYISQDEYESGSENLTAGGQ